MTETRGCMLTENMNSHIVTSSGRWGNFYDYVINGDLVLVGPVQNKQFGIAIERKHVSFGFEPDVWYILVDGTIKVYQSYMVQKYYEKELQLSFTMYNYNH